MAINPTMRFLFNCHNLSGAFSLQLPLGLIIVDRQIKKLPVNGIIISGEGDN